MRHTLRRMVVLASFVLLANAIPFDLLAQDDARVGLAPTAGTPGWAVSQDTNHISRWRLATSTGLTWRVRESRNVVTLEPIAVPSPQSSVSHRSVIEGAVIGAVAGAVIGGV